MPDIKGLKEVRKRLKAEEKKSKKKNNISVLVGYTANYALSVHERVNVPHKVGQAKFLEQPAREFSKEIGKIVRKGLLAGLTVGKSLLLGGLFLQRKSQKLVPIDTGNLKNSAFTREEK